MKEFIVIDTETTGLRPDLDEVLQLAIVDQDGLVLFYQKFRPEFLVAWPEAENIHHIKPADVANEHPYRYYKKKVQQIIRDTPLMVGYNLLFDLRFLDVELPFTMEIYDVMKGFAPIYGERSRTGYKWQTLESCAAYYGYTYHAHDALEDAKATLFCYQMIKRKKFA